MVKLHNLDLAVSDIQRSLEFYQRVLGLQVSPHSAAPSMMILEATGCTLSLHQSGTEGGRDVVVGSLELGFAVEDVVLVREKILAFGLECAEVVEFGFGSSFEAKDPDGYWLNFYKLR